MGRDVVVRSRLDGFLRLASCLEGCFGAAWREFFGCGWKIVKSGIETGVIRDGARFSAGNIYEQAIGLMRRHGDV
jgi:hypothetical protein